MQAQREDTRLAAARAQVIADIQRLEAELRALHARAALLAEDRRTLAAPPQVRACPASILCIMLYDPFHAASGQRSSDKKPPPVMMYFVHGVGPYARTNSISGARGARAVLTQQHVPRRMGVRSAAVRPLGRPATGSWSSQQPCSRSCSAQPGPWPAPAEARRSHAPLARRTWTPCSACWSPTTLTSQRCAVETTS